MAGTSVGVWRDRDGPRGSRTRLARLHGHGAAEAGEDDEPLAYLPARRLGEPAPIELQLRRVMRGLVAGLLLGDGVALVVHDDEAIGLFEDEVDSTLDQ